MSKPAEPWRWEDRRGWYAWVKGRRLRLASFEEGKRVALRRLHDMLDRPDAPAVPPVGKLVTEYLKDLLRRQETGEHEAQTKADFERRTAGFLEHALDDGRAIGDLPADEIRPHHVKAWLATRTAWGPTTRHDGIGAVKSAFKWAKREGHVAENPLSEMEKPARNPRREVIPETAKIEDALRAVVTPELADLLTFIFDTGCRPKEARTLEARHLDLPNGVAALDKHKTAKKTGKKRVIFLVGRSTPIVARLAEKHPEGPIFRNSRGEPWSHNAVGLAVRRLRQRTGAGPEMVAYALRHAFATDGLDRGVPVASMAEVLGHADTRMMAVYSHLSERTEHLREAAARVRGPAPEDGTPPAGS